MKTLEPSRRGPARPAAWFVAVTLAIAGVGAGPFASRQEPAQPTFRTSTNLVVIDAVVTDGRGRHVRDLTAADFDVVQNGRRRAVRQASTLRRARWGHRLPPRRRPPQRPSLPLF